MPSGDSIVTAVPALLAVLLAGWGHAAAARRRHDSVAGQLAALRSQVTELRSRVERWSHLP